MTNIYKEELKRHIAVAEDIKELLNTDIELARAQFKSYKQEIKELSAYYSKVKTQKLITGYEEVTFQHAISDAYSKGLIYASSNSSIDKIRSALVDAVSEYKYYLMH